MTRVLFIHQNLPGQFRRLIRHLQTQPGFALVAIGEEAAVRRDFLGPKLRVTGYPAPEGAGEKAHRCLKHFAACVRRGLSGRETVPRHDHVERVGLPAYLDLLAAPAAMEAA